MGISVEAMPVVMTSRLLVSDPPSSVPSPTQESGMKLASFSKVQVVSAVITAGATNALKLVPPPLPSRNVTVPPLTPFPTVIFALPVISPLLVTAPAFHAPVVMVPTVTSAEAAVRFASVSIAVSILPSVVASIVIPPVAAKTQEDVRTSEASVSNVQSVPAGAASQLMPSLLAKRRMPVAATPAVVDAKMGEAMLVAIVTVASKSRSSSVKVRLSPAVRLVSAEMSRPATSVVPRQPVQVTSTAVACASSGPQAPPSIKAQVIVVVSLKLAVVSMAVELTVTASPEPPPPVSTEHDPSALSVSVALETLSIVPAQEGEASSSSTI